MLALASAFAFNGAAFEGRSETDLPSPMQKWIH
jgi:hypothetical protein